MPAAAGVVREIILHVRHEVRVPGPGDGCELLVILALHVGIPENYGDWGAGGVALVDPAQDLGLVRLAPRRSAHRPGRAPCDIFLEIRFSKRNVLRHAVQHHAYGRPVALAEDGNLEVLSECIHINTKIGKFTIFAIIW